MYIEIFCWKKWEKLLQCKSFSHFFNKKYWLIWEINLWKFNKTLSNDVVSFEQPGSGCSCISILCNGRIKIIPNSLLVKILLTNSWCQTDANINSVQVHCHKSIFCDLPCKIVFNSYNSLARKNIHTSAAKLTWKQRNDLRNEFHFSGIKGRFL